MQTYSFIPIKHSIATQLLKAVFAMYLVLVLTLTVIHLTTEYAHTKARVLEELQSLEMTVKSGLTQALWEMNLTQTHSIMMGLSQLPIIVGVYIEDHKGNIVGQIGQVLNQQGQAVVVNQDGTQTFEGTASGLFWHTFPLSYPRGDRDFPVGNVTIYSGSSVIFARIRFGFLLLITNAVLQIVAFWVIFLWISRKMLSRPLTELTYATEQLQLENLENISVNVHTAGHNELKRLELAFNIMIQNLLAARQELQQVHDEHRQKLEQEVAQRTQELKLAKEDAETANRAKSAFLANMSHELRTPLNVILGFAQMMAHTPHTPEEHEHLSIIQRSGNHLLTLINQVLDLSKIEAGGIVLKQKNFALYSLLDELEDMFRMQAEKKGLQLVCERVSDVPRYIRADDVKLRQILINLLNNAIKFTEQGRVTLRIANYELQNEPTHHPSQEGKSEIRNLKFEIEDTGPGIAPEELGTVFEAFSQAEAGRYTQGGTGLGLPISRKFVQLMGGDMKVESQVERGTTFTFDIQAETVDPADIQGKTSARRVLGLELGQPQYRILVVDDEPDNRKLLMTLLTLFAVSPESSEGINPGFDLRETKNGQEAIDIWRTWQPHLIFMDIRMPVVDGYEATKKIRSAEEQKRRSTEAQKRKSATINNRQSTIIIAVTASTFEEERAMILSNGCDGYLRKPFREADIFDLLHTHLRIRFVYEGNNQAASNRQFPQDDLHAAIAALPAELVTALEEAARFCDMMDITAMLPEIRRYSVPLADTVVRLVDDFKYGDIIALLQKGRQNRQG